MKLAIARGPGQFGGVFRRFRELCAYAHGKHELVGLMPLALANEVLDAPIRTLCYDRRLVGWDIARASTRDAVLGACEGLISRIAADLERERPERILAADTDLKGLAVVAAARRVGIPVTTFVAGFASVEAQVGRTARPYPALAEAYCLEASDRLIFPSRFAAAHAAGTVPTLAPHVVVYNGIAAPFLEPVAVARDARRVGAVMRFSPIKNPEALGRIAAGLERHGIVLEVVTDPPSTPESQAMLGIARIVAPTLDTAELAGRYASWRALVAPSRFEASGNVPMEALAVGTPAVVTDRMGVAEILNDLGFDDCVVGVDDIDGTVDRLVRAEPVPDDIRATLRRTFAWPAVAERLVAVLADS